ncbi:MAG: hypothetical protein LBI99_00075 [Propionibacteriaceae bacterium]|jgi:hypothetical protein|nr:hypothetical protein [Propionibacteriaceae bacterium]
MPEINTKEQAERFVFANNAAQSNLFNTFNLYVVAIIGLAVALIAFLVGLATGGIALDVLAFVQAAFALGGLAFAIWSSETARDRVANTYLTQSGLLFEVNALVTCLVMIGTQIAHPALSVVAYLVPWIVYAATFFITYQVVRANVGAHERKATKTTSFSVLIVVVIIGIFVGKTVTSGTDSLVNALSAGAQGLVILGAGSLIALILGMLTAIGFFKNLLVKKFDIDLSPLYQQG